MRKLFTLAVALLASFSLVTHAATDGGSGIVHGANHVVGLQAPKGWMFDGESGAAQGLQVIFYPAGSEPQKSELLAYFRSRPKSEKIQTVDDVVKATVEKFRGIIGPKYDGKRIKVLKSEGGREIIIYHYAGGTNGAFEAAAYIVEEKSISLIVMSARSEKLFQDALPKFEDLAKSYVFLGEKVEIEKAKPVPPPAPEK